MIHCILKKLLSGRFILACAAAWVIVTGKLPTEFLAGSIGSIITFYFLKKQNEKDNPSS